MMCKACVNLRMNYILVLLLEDEEDWIRDRTRQTKYGNRESFWVIWQRHLEPVNQA
jgi:nicotinamide riboside kinase